MSSYAAGFWITSFIVFWISYISCFFAYGFLLGGIFGWIPSLIVAVMVGAIWPLVLLVALGLGALIYKSM